MTTPDEPLGSFADYESFFRAVGMTDDDPEMDAVRSVDRFFRGSVTASDREEGGRDVDVE